MCSCGRKPSWCAWQWTYTPVCSIKALHIWFKSTSHRECPHYSYMMAPICSNYPICQEILYQAGAQGSPPQTPLLYLTYTNPVEHQIHSQHSNPNHPLRAPITHPCTSPPPYTSYRSSFPSFPVSHNPNRLFLQLFSRPSPEPSLHSDLLPRNYFHPLLAPQADYKYPQ